MKLKYYTHTDAYTGGGKERVRDRDRKIDKQTRIQINRQTVKWQIGRWMDRQTDLQKVRKEKKDRRTGRKIDRMTDNQTERGRDKQKIEREQGSLNACVC